MAGAGPGWGAAAAALGPRRGPRGRPAAGCGVRGEAGLGRATGSEVPPGSPRALLGGIAEILMNRPHARNSLGKVFVNELFSALEQLRFDEKVRVVVFKSEVKGIFCAGADLKERAQMDDAEVGHFVKRLRNLMDEIAALPVPTIAAIDGYALGGGLEMALACDLRVAASSAKMGLIETTRGLLPGAGGTQRLPRCVGVGLAKELIFTGRQIDGQEAFSMGLVNHAVPQNEEGDAAYQRALTLAKEILPQVNHYFQINWYLKMILNLDRQEGMAAFKEKRPPRFIGK
uniref:Enoyl-CoA hydratase domain containing 2 n=1 Tax=Anas zonorhyncha TaxID=75864 RepID=A0A8B9UHZ0_9AVES